MIMHDHMNPYRVIQNVTTNSLFRSGNASFSFGMEMSGPAFKRSTFEVNLENRDRDEREQLLQGLGVQ